MRSYTEKQMKKGRLFLVWLCLGFKTNLAGIKFCFKSSYFLTMDEDLGFEHIIILCQNITYLSVHLTSTSCSSHSLGR